jgi:uncharacterized protein YecE (DUF72 family)
LSVKMVLFVSEGIGMEFYIGCPIWANKGWVGSLYPAGTKPSDYLRLYSRQLSTVEGNTTFYAVPAQATLEHLVEETPATFRFCPKIPKTISHAGKLVGHLAETTLFLQVMSQLGDRLGPCFLQLPPSYPPSMIDDLREFLAGWPPEAQLAVEVRHPGWYDGEHHTALQALLASHRMARVIIDTRPIRSLEGDKILQGSVYKRLVQARKQKPDLPIVIEPTAPFIFLRYIGHPDVEQNIPFLDEWAGYLTGWLREGLDAYVFCHCPDERLDPVLCHELHRRIAAEIPISPLPEMPTHTKPTQPKLL